MQDPMTLLFIIVIVLAVVAFWMMDTSRRAQAAKSRKLLTEARERADRAESSLAQARSDRDEAKKKADSATKQRDQMRKSLQKAKAKQRKSSGSELVTPANEEDGPTQHLRNQLEIVADELEGRVQRIAQLENELEAQAEAHAEAIMKASTRAVKPVRDIPEEARTDLRLFLGKMKAEIQTLERKANSTHRAYLAAEGRAEALTARLAGLQERYRAVCRELAIGAGANHEIDDDAAVAQAEQAVAAMEEAAAWSRLDIPVNAEEEASTMATEPEPEADSGEELSSETAAEVTSSEPNSNDSDEASSDLDPSTELDVEVDASEPSADHVEESDTEAQSEEGAEETSEDEKAAG